MTDAPLENISRSDSVNLFSGSDRGAVGQTRGLADYARSSTAPAPWAPRCRSHAPAARSEEPQHLTDEQRLQLDWVAKTDPRRHRAYGRARHTPSTDVCHGYADHACRPTTSSPARSPNHRQAIDRALDSGLSNGLIESTNTKIRLRTRISFGFHGPEPS
ncbi:MAG: transposase [Acidimicrobiia bacterium]